VAGRLVPESIILDAPQGIAPWIVGVPPRYKKLTKIDAPN
jgi:hypothetical protein